MPAPVQLVPRGSHGFEFGGVPLPLLVDDPLSLWMHDLGSLEASELKPACSWVEVDCTIVSEYLRHLGGSLVCPTTNYAICFHPDANKQPSRIVTCLLSAVPLSRVQVDRVTPQKSNRSQRLLSNKVHGSLQLKDSVGTGCDCWPIKHARLRSAPWLRRFQ